VRGRSADARSDIFAFGAILYEMLAGQRAFRGDSAADTMSAILKEDPPDISVTNQNVPPGVERIVRHCLEKNPEQRFHSAHDLAFDLEALSNVSSGPRPTSAATGAVRMRVPPAVGLLLVLLAVAGAYLAGRRMTGAGRGSAEELQFTQLTTRQEPIFNARFAPDGKTIVFSSAPVGNAPEIFTIRPGSPGVSPTGLKGMHLLSVSSRGELAVLTNAHYVRHKLFGGTLARTPLEGGAPREIQENVREADWSPDGSDLAVIRNVGGKDRLEFPLGKVLAETGGYFSDPRFSPDGKSIALMEHPLRFDDRGSVAVVDLGGRKTVLSDGYWAEEGIAWSPDGREVFFGGGSDYKNSRIYGVDGKGRRRTVLASPGGLTIHDVARDGRQLLTRDDHARDAMVLAAGQTRERDVSWLDLTFPLAFTADGKTVLLTEENTSLGPTYSTGVRGTDGSPAVRLGDGSAQDISPDGKWALAIVPSKPERVVMYPMGPGQTKTIETAPVVGFENAAFFPDGKTILLCGHEAGRGVRCYTQSISGGKPRPVTPEDRTQGVISPDGRRIIALGPAGPEVYPSEGGAGSLVPGSRPDDLPIRWGANARSVLVSREGEVPARIERLDLATDRRDLFRTVGPSDLTGVVQVSPIAVSADEKSYAYTSRRYRSLLFLVEGLK
jgi:Tol biopolymer transport system component